MMELSAESFGVGIAPGRLAYFNIKVNPFAPTYASSPLGQCYHRAELDKKRMYDKRIHEVAKGTFSPLVFSASGGIGTYIRSCQNYNAFNVINICY